MANGVAEGEAFLAVSGGLSGAEREHGTLASAVHRVRTDHAPANFTTIKHMALNLIRRAQARIRSASAETSPFGMTTFFASLIAA